MSDYFTKIKILQFSRRKIFKDTNPLIFSKIKLRNYEPKLTSFMAYFYLLKE